MPWLPKKLQNVMAVTDCVALFWQPNPISVGRANPECREMAMKKNLFEKEFVPCRPDLACDRLVCVRRWRRSLDPLYLSAASTSTWSWMLSWRVTDPVALRPTWKGNLFWLLVIFVIVLAVAS